MRITIDKGTEKDFEELERLYDDVNTYLAEQEFCGALKKGIYPVRETIRTGIEEGNLYVARIFGGIIGAVILRIQTSNGRRVCVIHALAVLPVFMRHDVGKRLMEFAVKYGRGQKAQAVRMEVPKENIPAVRLCRACGFWPMVMVAREYGEEGEGDAKEEQLEVYQMLL